MLLDDLQAREHAIALYDTDAASWSRARGWALSFAVLLAGLDDPAEARYHAMGQKVMRNLLAGP